MKLNKIKNNIKKIPLLRYTIKLIYDWHREKLQQKTIKQFLSSNHLAYTDIPPDYYVIGHEPTIRCNLKCKMCYQGNTRMLRKEELNTEEILSIYQKLKNRAKSIKLVGGEPFMRHDIIDLIKFWNDENIKIILQTNCTLMSNARMNSLSQFKNIIDIATSLDGPPEIHDAIRGVPGAFNKLQNAIHAIQTNLPDVTLTLFAVLLMEDNLNKLNNLIDSCLELKIHSLQILFEQFYTQEEVNLSIDIFEKMFGWKQNDYQLNTRIKDTIDLEKMDSFRLKSKLNNIRSYGLKRGCYANYTPFNFFYNVDTYFSTTPTRSFCTKLLKPELRINQKGEVIWCDVIEKAFGNLMEKTPDQIWLSKEYQHFRNYLFTGSFPICRRCCKAVYIN